jgi:serine/threonine-protein kinase
VRAPGEEFAHYKIESLLGQGGMGEVYRAFDTKLHRRVALKLLLTSESTSREAKTDAVARIIREARAAAALEHPNKVSIFELGEVEGTPYLAMEYIAGSTLRAFVGDAKITWKQKLGWLVDVARALDAAHAAGLVHRDIKPENVMVREDGIVKVLDFGIARRADAPADPSAPTTAPAIETLTGKGVIIGTAAYMPPEQMHGRDLDGRADQFSWGVMAFELLSGKHPWATGGDTLALVGAMLTKPAPRLEGVPDVVAETIARTLVSERDARWRGRAGRWRR